MRIVRGRWIYDKALGRVVPYEEYQSPEVNAPNVVTDEMPPTFNHADCQIYTSKRKMRDSYRRLGKVEVDENWRAPAPGPRPGHTKEDIERAVAKAYNAVKYGHAPLSEFDKERCKIINRQIENSYDTRNRDPDRTD